MLALLVHTPAATVVNVAAYTARSLIDTVEDEKAILAWILEAYGLAARMSEGAGPLQGLTTF
jgi:hypothetical protein